MITFIYYRILIAQDVEYLRCILILWLNVVGELSQRKAQERLTPLLIYPTYNMVGIVF